MSRWISLACMLLTISCLDKTIRIKDPHLESEKKWQNDNIKFFPGPNVDPHNYYYVGLKNGKVLRNGKPNIFAATSPDKLLAIDISQVLGPVSNEDVELLDLRCHIDTASYPKMPNLYFANIYADKGLDFATFESSRDLNYFYATDDPFITFEKECKTDHTVEAINKFCHRFVDAVIAQPRVVANPPSAYKGKLPEKYEFVTISGITDVLGKLGEGVNGVVFLVRERNQGDLFAAKFFKHNYSDMAAAIGTEVKEVESWLEFGNPYIMFFEKDVLFKTFSPGDTLKKWIASGRLFNGSEQSVVTLNKLVDLWLKIINKKYSLGDFNNGNLIFDLNQNTWVVVDGYKLAKFETVAEAFSYFEKQLRSSLLFDLKIENPRYQEYIELYTDLLVGEIYLDGQVAKRRHP